MEWEREWRREGGRERVERGGEGENVEGRGREGEGENSYICDPEHIRMGGWSKSV